MLLIYTEKPYISRHIISKIMDEILEYGNGRQVKILHSLYFKGVQFNYPQNLSITDYPYIQEPSLQNFKLGDPSLLFPSEIKNSQIIPSTFEESDFFNVNEILFLTEPYHSNIYFSSIFSNLLSQKINKTIPSSFVLVHDITKEDIISSFNNRTEISSLNNYLKIAKIKNFFNFNFNMNSHKFFGNILHNLNQNPNKIVISKYTLQVLLAIEDILTFSKVSEDDLLEILNNWKGTGLYQTDTTVGDEISKNTIIQNLKNLNFISFNNPNQNINLTESFNSFKSFLHPNCKDLDLPFKFKHWQTLNYSQAENLMSNYLSNIFNEQKQFLVSKNLL